MDAVVRACELAVSRPHVGMGVLRLAAVTLAAIAGHAGAAEVELTVARDGQRFEVRAQALMRADLATAWATLTDYEALPGFVPGIHRVRIAARQPAAGGERLTVDYEGRFRLLFFVLPTRVRLDNRHAPPVDVHARSLPSPADGPDAPPPALKGFDGVYHLAAADGDPTVTLTHWSRFELAQPLPPIVGPLFAGPALRHVLRRQLDAMAGEIERRAAAAAAGAARAAGAGPAPAPGGAPG